MTLFQPARDTLLTLALAWAAAQLCLYLQTPLPWMLGPLISVSLVSVLGAPTRSWNPLRNAGQWVIGAALGLYFTPEVVQLISGLWWAIALGVAWALWMGWGFGRCLQVLNAPHIPGLDRATTYYAGAIGGASEMTLLAERQHARTDLVAAAHSLRVLIVTVLVPFAMQWGGWGQVDILPPPVREVQASGLLLMGALTLLGVGAMLWLQRANPWFMGALLVSMGLTMSSVSLSAIPVGLSNAAQLCIGVSLGVRFNTSFIHAAPRWLISVAVGSLLMIALCAGFAWVLQWTTHMPWPTLVLGTAPGGIAEMAITAKVLHLGVPVVTAFQVCRLVAVLVLVNPLYHWLYLRRPAR